MTGFDPMLALRLLAGIYFIPHVINLVRNFSAVQGFFQAAGMQPSKPFVVLTIVVETFCAIGLIAGVAIVFVAGLACLLLLIAAYAAFRVNGPKWLWISGGPEFPVFWAIVCAIVGAASAI